MHARSRLVFDTTGCTLASGRWHSLGTRVVYSAQHASLALLETLIHSAGRRIPPRALTTIHISDDLPIETAPWQDLPASQRFGDEWVRTQRSAVLSVPSIVVSKLEQNFIFNPAHPDFHLITAAPPTLFELDPRFILF